MSQKRDLGKGSLYLPRKKSGLIQKGGGGSAESRIFFETSFGPFLESRNRRVGGSRKARVQTFSEKIFPLQMFTLESKKGWGAGV